MGGTELFAGGYLNAVDAKGRVSLPASFRDVIERNTKAATGHTEKLILVGEHERLPCLEAFDNSHVPEFRAAIEQRLDANPPADRIAAWEELFVDTLGSKERVKFDDAGRMVLPAGLRQDAGIEEQAWFVSAGGRFHIWNPFRFREAHAHTPRTLKSLERQMAEKGLL